MSGLPAPLTPAEADLQDFPFMPLHVARLRDSDLAAEEQPEACWYAVLLWSSAWHQLPAGSLPDNETVLCKLLGLGRDIKTFRRYRNGALRGWIKCSDGRLYHSVVAEQVLAAWQGKLEQRHRTECARLKKHNQRYAEHPDKQLHVPTFDEWLSKGQPADVPRDKRDASPKTSEHVPEENPSKGKGKGQGQGQGDYNTEADASGAEAPKSASAIDLRAAVFASGVPLLSSTGLSDANARSMIGRWRKTYTDGAVLDALSAATAESPSDPVAWINRTLEKRNGHRHEDPRLAGLGPTARAAIAAGFFDGDEPRPA